MKTKPKAAPKKAVKKNPIAAVIKGGKKDPVWPGILPYVELPPEPTDRDVPAEEPQSHFNYRVDLALAGFEKRLKQLQAIVAELQKLPTAIAPQTQSQISTLQEITGNLSNLK